MSAVNLIITDLCVFEVKQSGGLVLIELHNQLRNTFYCNAPHCATLYLQACPA